MSLLHLHRHRLAPRPVLVQVAWRERELGLVVHENRHAPPFILESELLDLRQPTRFDLDDDSRYPT